MNATLDKTLLEEFTALLSSEGVHEVSNWTLPNNDVPFDEEAALEDFCTQLDGVFARTSAAMDSISAAKK